MKLIRIKKFQKSFHVQFSCWPWDIIWNANSTNRRSTRLRDPGAVTTAKNEIYIGMWKLLYNGGRDKNLVGRNLLERNFSRWGAWVNSRLVGGGDSPHPASRENPAGCIWKTQSEQYVSWVEGFMQNLFSFLFSLVFSGDLYFEFLIVELF